jgi:hypothetical protein
LIEDNVIGQSRGFCEPEMIAFITEKRRELFVKEVNCGRADAEMALSSQHQQSSTYKYCFS